MRSSTPSRLITQARARVGLSQRELARLAGTAQSVVARIELGLASPSWSTLARLLGAAGFELRGELLPAPTADTHMLEDTERILRLTPEQRLIEIRNVGRFTAAARRV